jgi:predicted 3-demethylubiquinone-9 3-methyltransferase (glyoxalase superfamily)
MTATATSRNERTQTTSQKITTFLWFNDNAEEAVNFYVSIFKNSKILNTTKYGESGAGPKERVMTIDFELDGQRFAALNGGPNFKFTEAISLVVNCETQEEVDYFWEKLSEGGQKVQCGWLKDKFGLSWQVVPNIVTEVFESGDQAKVDRMMKAVMQMVKLDAEELRKAAEGK